MMGATMDLSLQVVATGTATTEVGKARAAGAPPMGALLVTVLLVMGHRLAVHKDKALAVIILGILGQTLALVVVLDLEMAPAPTQAPARVQAVALLTALRTGLLTVEAQDLGQVQEVEVDPETNRIQGLIRQQAMVQVLDLREVMGPDQMVETVTATALDLSPALAHHQAMVQMAVETVHQHRVNQHLRPDHKVISQVVVIPMPTIPPIVVIQGQMADRPLVHKLEPAQAKLEAKEMALEVLVLEAATGPAVGRNQHPLRIKLVARREVVQAATAALTRATLCQMMAQKQHRERLYPVALHLQDQVDQELQDQQARHYQLLFYPTGHQLSTLALTQREHLED
jgi:hypothetical protein